MAQRVSVFLADDITGEEADETVEFELDGARYQGRKIAETAIKLHG